MEFRRGWRALTAATIGIGVGIAIVPAYTNGLVVAALQSEFGWSRAQQSTLQLLASIVLIVTAPVVGFIADRWGVRWPSVFGMVVLGVSYFVLAASGPSFTVYFLLFGLMYLLGSPSTAVSFTRAVNQRFDRNRGVALGISLSGAGLVAFLLPALLGPLLAENWRLGYRLIAVAVLVCALVVLVLMPGGRSPQRSPQAGSTQSETSVLPLLRQALFVRLAVAFVLLSIGAAWIGLFLVSLLRDAGVSAADAARTASLIGIALIVSRIAVGMLVDRFFAPRVGAAVLALAAAGLIALLLGGPALGSAAAIAAGLALGAEVDLVGNLTSRYYPMHHYSRMFGVLYAVSMIGVGVSPVLISALREATGSYGLALIISAGLLVIAGALLFTAPRFPVEAESATTQVPATEPVTERPSVS
ncbi:MFS transporter [Saccharopolyspora sp. ASAGF58]|uniref:MFS transporter n=1 Tax=Saccharopolyspora sp. ASAGF58 TaxID=2719023 RepID=UPI0014401CC7|nr:MFS transporter [Saccharopolyspora sp. ASAGF58]QIZ36890.1 MFS transporter [Saccharopolyspora sp. ASAGF58]